MSCDSFPMPPQVSSILAASRAKAVLNPSEANRKPARKAATESEKDEKKNPRFGAAPKRTLNIANIPSSRPSTGRDWSSRADEILKK